MSTMRNERRELSHDPTADEFNSVDNESFHEIQSERDCVEAGRRSMLRMRRRPGLHSPLATTITQ